MTESSKQNQQEKQKSRSVGRPRKHKENRPAAERGVVEGETRASFIVRKDQLEDLKNIAYWERLKIKDVVIQAIDDRIEKYKKQNGDVKSRP